MRPRCSSGEFYRNSTRNCQLKRRNSGAPFEGLLPPGGYRRISGEWHSRGAFPVTSPGDVWPISQIRASHGFNPSLPRYSKRAVLGRGGGRLFLFRIISLCVPIEGVGGAQAGDSFRARGANFARFPLKFRRGLPLGDPRRAGS